MIEWFPGVISEPGPVDKTGYPNLNVRRGKGVVCHSAEGSLESALAVLAGPRRASWHFTVAKDGRVFQHYPLSTVTWHGGFDANEDYVGIESEGVAGEALTVDQFWSLVRLLDWIRDQESWPIVERHVTLFEHNEFMPTACPSGRIPWDRIIPEMRALAPGRPTDLQIAESAAWLVAHWTSGQGHLVEPYHRERLLWAISNLPPFEEI